MHTIEFLCPQCSEWLKVPREYAGRRERCKSCGEAVLVPSKSQVRSVSNHCEKVPRSVPHRDTTKEQSEQEVREFRPSWKLLYVRLWVSVASSFALVLAFGSTAGSASERILLFMFLMVIFAGFTTLHVWLTRISNVLKITDKHCLVQCGILSRRISEVRHTDVRNIQVKQGVFDRFLNIGTIGVSTAAQSDVEITIQGIDEPSQVRDMIDEYRN